MKMSTKGKYGLRAMLDLALHANGEHVALNHIAKRQEISVNYLEQVFSTLRKAGLVKSVKGAQGGYTLAEEPDRIKVGTILRHLEGELTIVEEEMEGLAHEKYAIPHFLQYFVWDKMNQAVHRVVDEMTLADLLQEFKKHAATEADMFYI